MWNKERSMVRTILPRPQFPLLPVVVASFLVLNFSGVTLLEAQSSTNGAKRSGASANESIRPSGRPEADDFWRSWGDDAFEKARSENKPVLLWICDFGDARCRIMQRDVLRHPEVMEQLKNHFICLKVLSEDLPAVTEVYRTATESYLKLAKAPPADLCPLTLFLTPDRQPFAAGTLFTLYDADDQPGFLSVLTQVKQAWSTQEADARSTARVVTRDVTRKLTPETTAQRTTGDEELVSNVVAAVSRQLDATRGGWPVTPETKGSGWSPFPCRLHFLQRQVGRSGVDPELVTTLDAVLNELMNGPLHDHLGGGFHEQIDGTRPHRPRFQKRLEPNALLAEVYVDAYRRTGRDAYRRTAETTYDFLIRELMAPEGGFYAGLSSDTNGDNGGFYLWTLAELEQVLKPTEFRLVTVTFGVPTANRSDTPFQLTVKQERTASARQLALPVREFEMRVEEVRLRLLEHRQLREKPSRDSRMMTAGNGIAIRSLASAGRTLNRRDYIEAAERAALRLLARHREPAGLLLHSMSGDSVGPSAVLDDYAFLVSGLLELYETTSEEKWLNAARRLNDDQIGSFWDPKSHGFFLTSHGQPAPLVRVKFVSDRAIPCGNSVSAQNLVRLAKLKSDESYRNYAVMLFNTFGSTMQQSPAECPAIALALQDYLHWFGPLEPTGTAGGGLFSGGLSSPRPEDSRPLEPASRIKPNN